MPKYRSSFRRATKTETYQTVFERTCRNMCLIHGIDWSMVKAEMDNPDLSMNLVAACVVNNATREARRFHINQKGETYG